MGTPYYMSMEQARGAKEVDLRTDIYALGVILYEILTGSKPHPGDTYNEILYHVITSEPTPLDSMRPGLPSGLAAVVHKAMAREPGSRYASTVELMKALIPYAGRSVTPIHSQVGMATSSRETASSPVSLPAIAVSRTVAEESPRVEFKGKSIGKSRSSVIALALGIVVVLMALGTWLALGRGRSMSTTPPAPVSASTPRPTSAASIGLSPPVQPVAAPPPVHAPTAFEGNKTFENPPGRPPERPAGQRQGKPTRSSAGSVVEIKVPRTLVPTPQTADSPEALPAPRGRPLRAIDRKNPFAE